MKRIILALLLLGLFQGEIWAQYDFTNNQSYRKKDVAVLDLMKGKQKYGNAIMIFRGRSEGKLKAKYFASGNTYLAFDTWRKNKNVVLISSAGYSTGFSYDSKPIGVCVDNGEIVNMQIKQDMDALVIVQNTGGVTTSDIDACDLKLASLGKEICPIRDKIELLKWGEAERATIFQTHLLAFSNKLALNKRNSSPSQAKRRFLVLGRYKGQVIHAIFHITQNMSLFDAADDVLKTLINQKVDVVSILNLDTGGNNVLEVYKDNGKKIAGIEGDAKPEQSTNLLVYYYD